MRISICMVSLRNDDGISLSTWNLQSFYDICQPIGSSDGVDDRPICKRNTQAADGQQLSISYHSPQHIFGYWRLGKSYHAKLDSNNTEYSYCDP